jgi:hypothetical protein
MRSRCPAFRQTVARNHQSSRIFDSDEGILLTVQRRSRWVRAGPQWTVAMIETITAVMGLVSAGIFLAHAFEGFRSRA